MEKDPLWKRMIVAKYDQASLGDFPAKIKFSSRKAPWHSIIEGID